MAAAYQVYQITGDRDWLTKKVRGKSILERLDASLEYLIRERFDARYGLILSAFTADWGDVSPLYPDQRAIYLDPQTPQVVGLYTNCQFYRAANQLSEMLRSLDQHSRADYWRRKASATKANMNRHLWQEDRGFYRMHLAVTPDRARGWPDDSNIFATGGNGLAVLYEIADAGKIRSIFHTAQELSGRLGISSVSGALLPPYPRGFFKYPSMKEEYSYQNGGQWDWFGGRFVLAEFERGYAEPAHRHLVEIARKVVLGGGLYEWHTKEGRGRGSPRYSGSAGAVAAACFQGLFGVYLRASGLELKVRLGSLSGQIQLHQPATDSFVRYRYRYDAQAGRVTMRYESNSSSEGSLSILVPKSSTVAELWLDGEERSFSVETVGQDQYVKVSTDWSPHELRLQFE